MSLITSCPTCGTMFRVVPDQLKISEGWVRCGHCAEVFDATAYLTEEPVALAAPGQAAPALDVRTMPAPMATVPGSLEHLAGDEKVAGLDSQWLESAPLDAPFVFRRSDMFGPGPLPSVQQPPPVGDSRPAPLKELPEDGLDDLSFVWQARRRTIWRRPLVRVALTLVSLLLAAALLLQVAWTDRDRIAAAQPQLQQALAQMCELLQCTLGPPHQIEAVVIESSGFNRLRNDAYRLSFSVRNTARVAVATPSMELTLTDSQDQPVLRKVLSPAELGARENVIAGGAEWSGTFGVVLANSPATRVAGYRLLAFYP